MQIDEKLKLINDLMERKKNENAIKENEVYKLLLAAIDNTALPKLAEDIKLLADKLQSVEKQAPEYYQRALKQLYGLANEIKNTEVRLSEISSQTAQNTKKEITRTNKELKGLIKQVSTKTEELTKELASIQLKHGKDGYTPVKGKDYFDGRPGKDGEDGIGIDGVGIEKAEIKGLNLVITLTNGEEIDVGKVVGRDGWSASGKSAYQYAKESGYTGTEAEFSEALSNIGESGGGTWGSITGTLSAQTDLQEALNAKANTGDIPTALSELTADETHRTVTDTEKSTWSGKQEALVSGTNIKTINGASVLGSGNITVAANKTRKNFFVENDFLYNNQYSFFPWYGSVISSGVLSAGTGTANNPGVIYLTSSTTANSGYYIQTAATMFLLASGETSEFVFYMPSSINTNTTIRLGFQDSATYTAPTDGVWVNISGTTLSGKTSSNNTASTTGTTYTVSAATWYRAKLTVNNSSFVTFEHYDLNENLLWSDTLTANIPTGAGRHTGHGIIATNSGTTAAQMIYIDYMNLKIDRELAR